MTYLATIFLLLIGSCTYYLTYTLYRYALTSRKLLDIPNHRSSHAHPTPSGGGLTIVTAFFVTTIILYASGQIPFNLWMAVGGGILVAFISGWDDIKPLPIRLRLSIHFLAAIWSLIWINTSPETLPFVHPSEIPDRIGIFLLSVLWITWMTNLYNFMDGIDGLAASQAVTTALSAGFFIWLGVGQPGTALLMFTLAAACLGFLPWNWPPARIFMGDIGSCFLGFGFGLFSLIPVDQGGLPFWCWPILLAVFICDASMTLFQRYFSGQDWHLPHRSHAYQHAAQIIGHRTTTLAIIAVNVFWLWPWAAYVLRHPEYGMIIAAIVYLPLILLARFFGAGQVNGIRTINPT
ncbi:MAG: hypothetical protein AXA67_09710 [Methylothermaceae bacteria B42]|nr:MAG: hypothetical protein AXA67_09710 [Methylothermaceae bacteria B42]HHJ39579.1 glycosyltransferase family 4 protein [Methylothermaceae bacterium]